MVDERRQAAKLIRIFVDRHKFPPGKVRRNDLEGVMCCDLSYNETDDDDYEEHLQNANLDGLDLSGADLSARPLEGASLRNTNLKDAIVNGARVGGCDMRGVIISARDLAKMKDLEEAFLDPGRYADAVAAGYKPRR